MRNSPSLRSATGWRAVLIRWGRWRAMAAITVFSMLASVLLTWLAFAALLHLPPESVAAALMVAAIVPAIVAPLASYAAIGLLFDLETARAELLRMATRDGLTGRYNRHYFMERLEREVRHCRESNSPLSLLMIDADGFKAINDRYGHGAGDYALQEIARACAAELQAVDVLARYGGEEFVALMPGATAERAAAIAERIRGGIAALRIEHAGRRIAVTVSLGLGTLRSGDASDAAMVERADAALYRAKRKGRNRLEIEDPETSERRDAAAPRTDEERQHAR